MDDLALNYQSDFNTILQMIADACRKAAYQVNVTMIDFYWGIGEFVSHKAVQDGWGRSTVKALSEYILTQEPGIRGYSQQNIWRMKQFFEFFYGFYGIADFLRSLLQKTISGISGQLPMHSLRFLQFGHALRIWFQKCSKGSLFHAFSIVQGLSFTPNRPFWSKLQGDITISAPM